MATRRAFLKTALGSATLVSSARCVPGFLAQAGWAAQAHAADRDTLLVAVQLAGGNDGLNTVVPFDDDLYGRNRRTLRLRGQEVLKLNESLGLHPRMPGFFRLYQEGLLGVVQGVGYPNPSGAHEESMRYWQTARPHEPGCRVGWLGRVADGWAEAGQADLPAVFVGQIPRPLTLNAQCVVVPSLRGLSQSVLVCPSGPESASAHAARLAAAAEPARPTDAPLAEFVRQHARAAYAASRRIDEVVRTAGSAPAGAYPDYSLAQTLRVIAQLIRVELGIRIFHAELGGNDPGGFDNHANQRDNHAALLEQLSESVAAFVHDLRRDRLLDRVLLFTFSEFGRTLAENGRRGTDHGSAAPMFLVGGRVRGGLIGPHPRLDQLENGGPQHHTDFRSVYAALLDRWLGVPSQPVLGATFDALDILKS